MINQRNLFKLESRLKVGQKTIPIKALEKDYVLSWILVGIASTKIGEILSFKGGTALKKCYFLNYRFSEDLDFTLLKSALREEIITLLERVYATVLEKSNLKIALQKHEAHRNGYTFFLNFSGPLMADLSRGEIKIDFTTKEKLIYDPIQKLLLREYEEYSDLPKNIGLKVYPLEEIFVEKYLSILDLSRREPRDLYDLWYLLLETSLDDNILANGVREKVKFKGFKSFDIIKILTEKKSDYQKLWSLRLAQHMIELPYFNKVYRELRQRLKPLNKLLVSY